MVSRLARFQHAFVRRLSELGITYRGSPIVEGPGKRYFDDSMRDGKGILSRFLLVLDSDAEPSTTEAAKQLVGSFSDVVELRVARQQGYACPARWLHRILRAQPRWHRSIGKYAFAFGAPNKLRQGGCCPLAQPVMALKASPLLTSRQREGLGRAFQCKAVAK
jgi:hypothetical protein